MLVLPGLLYRFVNEPNFTPMAHPPYCLFIIGYLLDLFFSPENGAKMSVYLCWANSIVSQKRIFFIIT
jgi:hypothetical protein